MTTCKAPKHCSLSPKTEMSWAMISISNWNGLWIWVCTTQLKSQTSPARAQRPAVPKLEDKLYNINRSKSRVIATCPLRATNSWKKTPGLTSCRYDIEWKDVNIVGDSEDAAKNASDGPKVVVSNDSTLSSQEMQTKATKIIPASWTCSPPAFRALS